MRNKRKRRQAAAEQAAPREPKAPGIATAFGALLERAGLNKLESAGAAQKAAGVPAATRSKQPPKRAPAPPQAAVAKATASEDVALTPRERALLHQVYAGVDPIHRPKRGRVERPARRAGGARAAPEAAAEAAARARLSDLVGGGVRFEVAWDEGFVQGLRKGAQRKLLARLSGSSFRPEAELDLHGLRRAEVERAVSQFVRAEHRRGRRYLLFIPGKGQHSEDGVGVLGRALAEALSAGSAAPLVLAFASAHTQRGGQGAVAVMLE